MAYFTSAVKIANRALQKVGASRVTSLDTTVDTSKEADEVSIPAMTALRRSGTAAAMYGASRFAA
jgi:hypothetical protein